MKSHIITTILAFLLLSCNEQNESNRFPTQAWETSSFENEYLNREPINDLLNEIENGVYGNVDQLLLIKNGKLVLDQSFTNNYKNISKGKSGILGCGFSTCKDSTKFGDYNYYHPNWHPYYQNQRIHTLQSVTKSIASIMIGVAIKEGDIRNTDVKVLDFFDDFDLSKVDESLKTVTLEDLLTMQLGMEWHEIDRPLDSTNTTAQLEGSKDWIQFTLNQPMDTLPGTKWVYNSGASQLMSGIIKKATGLYIDEYAEKHLFTPLGIKNFHWKKAPTGYPDALGGLYLEVQDLAKIGYLMLNNGTWDGQQIISSEWVKRSVSKHVTFENEGGYGYQWWRDDEDGIEIWACHGFGGQYLLVFPKFQSIAIVNSWNIFDEEIKSIARATRTAVIQSNSL
ncbi:serine hydrolase domain-containing protein [Croceitalea marina]|uniref:Serine hydrolase domain-containing protein n=1 Tax=Croceitalea marina TaxID=1775166 RepID=A0ABW5N164_9FLAO